MADKVAKNRQGRSANKAKTHCPDDHPYDETNTHVDGQGRRSCKKCRATRAKAWQAAHRTASA
jgi:hypothetical protein